MKQGSIEYTLSKLCILDVNKVFPHEKTKDAEVFSIRDAMNRIDPVLGKRLSPIPIMVSQIEKSDEYVVLDGMHRFRAMKERGCADVFAYSVDYANEAKLCGWDAVIQEDFNLKDVLKKTTEDFAIRNKGELASGKMEWKSIITTPEEAQQKVVDGTFPFCLIKKLDRGRHEAYYPVKKKGLFSLKDKVQALVDFDEAVESLFGGPHIFRFVADDVSIKDYEFLKAPYLLIRARFTKQEIQSAAKDRFLLPKKTTRHIFALRPIVHIPVDILDDNRKTRKDRWAEAIHFITTTYRDRYYPEPVHYFPDVIATQDTTQRCPDIKTALKKKKEIEADPKLAFAREWAPKETAFVCLPGPVGYSDMDITGGEIRGYTVGHRSRDFEELYKKTSDAVRWMLDPTFGKVYKSINACLMPAPATHSMAVAALSSVLPDRKILHIVAGAFGGRWSEISRDFGQLTEEYRIKPGHPFTTQDAKNIEAILTKQGGQFDAVTIIYNETSTGTFYDLRKVYAPIKKAEDATGKDILFLVDAASAFGGMPIDGLENVDLLILSTEKCLALPPGISVLVTNEKAVKQATEHEKILKRHTGYTTSLTRIYGFHQKNQTLGTPAIPQITMLLKTIQKIHGYVSLDGRYVPGEGLENRYERFRQLAAITRKWAKKLKFTTLATRPSICSSTVTAIVVDPYDGDKIVERLMKVDKIDLSGGHRDLKDAAGNKLSMLRIPHMGSMKSADLRVLLSRISNAIA